MKRKTIIVAVLMLMVACFAGCGKNYDDVKAALGSDTWYFNGGGDTVLNSISFAEEEATITQVYFDGNGIHDNGSNSYPYSIDDENITVELSEDDALTIPYTMEEEKPQMGEGYLTAAEVDAGLQGYWNYHYSDVLLGIAGEGERTIYINNGQLTSENAAKSAFGADGEYFYYGPYTGTYTLGLGTFETNMEHGNEWFFNIVDGKPVVLRYDHICSPTDKLPGPKGYKF